MADNLHQWESTLSIESLSNIIHSACADVQWVISGEQFNTSMSLPTTSMARLSPLLLALRYFTLLFLFILTVKDHSAVLPNDMGAIYDSPVGFLKYTCVMNCSDVTTEFLGNIQNIWSAHAHLRRISRFAERKHSESSGNFLRCAWSFPLGGVAELEKQVTLFRKYALRSLLVTDKPPKTFGSCTLH